MTKRKKGSGKEDARSPQRDDKPKSPDQIRDKSLIKGQRGIKKMRERVSEKKKTCRGPTSRKKTGSSRLPPKVQTPRPPKQAEGEKTRQGKKKK